ncbi:ABC transporter ATP-binding protein [Methylobacterium sp. SyP6R]|uniref:ABC transporter ATP-binding protein n=1 Tax=Methylobacterium sp. SyP6R TaxID=2718876 RepID=UPI001F3C24DE|nr:ABC transporter ATP-binding protein [Methylobacterium sp. SyP6R]MCF4130178.1 ABC transporter ATP-binding protein [Methylobacterium sp. SyP6R]
MTIATPLLSVADLAVTVPGPSGPWTAVAGIDLALARGETLGLIGESGSGKTLTGLALLGLLPSGASATARQLTFDGHDLRGGEPVLAPLRGRRLGMIVQDPVGAFNPAKRIGWHMRAVLRRRGDRRPDAAARWLSAVGVRAAERVLAAYPHQLSGGMLQRVLIAMVGALEPDLIVADEPTTNLDAVVARQILDLVREQQNRTGCAVLFVTHDLAAARHLCDRVAVMVAGTIVEIGPAGAVLDVPRHPYTRGLIATVRSLAARDPVLIEMVGEPGRRETGGCPFLSRCPRSDALCRSDPPGLAALRPDHLLRCHHPDV